MSAIQVKNVPPEIHQQLRQRAAEENMTVSEYVLNALRRDLELPTQRDWVQRVIKRKPVKQKGINFAALLREIRDEEAM